MTTEAERRIQKHLLEEIWAKIEEMCNELGIEVPEYDKYEPLEFSEPTEEQQAEDRALWEKHFGKFIADTLFGEEENDRI